MSDNKRKNPSVAEYVTAMIELSGKKQNTIAAEVGFPRPNMVSMIKNGKTRLPIDKIGLFARSVGADPFYLYCLVTEEYDPKLFEVLQRDVFSSRTILSHEESEVFKMLKDKKDAGLAFDNKFKQALSEFLKQF